MASAKQQENMLLTEHFTWPPISLIDDIINAINEVLYRCTDSFETGLLAADPALLGFADLYGKEGRTPERDEDGNDVYPEARLEIEEGVLKLETLMENAVDKNFDRLEIWTLRNVLCIGSGAGRGEEELVKWVRLGHYENLQAPSKDSKLDPEVLFNLRRKLVETQKLNAALEAEKNRNEAQIAKLRALLQPAIAPKREPRNSTSPAKATNGTENGAPFAFLTHTPAAQALGVQPLPQASVASTAAPESRTPLTTHTSFTTSQLPYLRQLLSSLKPHLPTTALPTSTNKNSDELSRERKVYLESQSKRILEKRGVDTKDGVEGAWEGRRPGAEEVRGLEALAQGLGRGRKEDIRMEDAGAGAVDGGEEMDTS
ncbi:Mis12 domain-containing protein [Setomelanomma holmii]|uniref:Mis12 domain-containing protein n=1 Tax=Setomelanomma holmii TaxID=210430 RepID=A0A9P4HIC2_9PLEO|nr:Mis12 domain-containing protein [Setomelanomma holmii]